MFPMTRNMFRKIVCPPVNNRTFKNFGHKRQPEPLIDVLFHGFLTFTFIGLCIEWKQIAQYLFPEENDQIEGTIEGDLTQFSK